MAAATYGATLSLTPNKASPYGVMRGPDRGEVCVAARCLRCPAHPNPHQKGPKRYRADRAHREPDRSSATDTTDIAACLFGVFVIRSSCRRLSSGGRDPGVRTMAGGDRKEIPRRSRAGALPQGSRARFAHTGLAYAAVKSRRVLAPMSLKIIDPVQKCAGLSAPLFAARALRGRRQVHRPCRSPRAPLMSGP
jgi:hypothetical protein